MSTFLVLRLGIYCYGRIFIRKTCNKQLQNLRKMVDRIRKFQILNDQIFACLAKHLCIEDDIPEKNNNNNKNDNKNPLEHWSHLKNNTRNNNRPIVEHMEPVVSNSSDLPLTVIDRVG